MKKWHKLLLTLLVAISLITVLSIGVYIDDNVISFFLGMIYLMAFSYVIYKLKGWDKEDRENEENEQDTSSNTTSTRKR